MIKKEIVVRTLGNRIDILSVLVAVPMRKYRQNAHIGYGSNTFKISIYNVIFSDFVFIERI